MTRRPVTISNDELATDALASWGRLNELMSKLTQPQVAYLLMTELYGGRRDQFIKRLHQRLARMRTVHELKQLRQLPVELKPSLHDHDLDWLLTEL